MYIAISLTTKVTLKNYTNYVAVQEAVGIQGKSTLKDGRKSLQSKYYFSLIFPICLVKLMLFSAKDLLITNKR